MKLVKWMGLALVSMLAVANAFAGHVTARVNGGRVYLPSCGGTVQINNGGHDSQLNAVFRNVVDCSFIIT